MVDIPSDHCIPEQYCTMDCDESVSQLFRHQILECHDLFGMATYYKSSRSSNKLVHHKPSSLRILFILEKIWTLHHRHEFSSLLLDRITSRSVSYRIHCPLCFSLNVHKSHSMSVLYNVSIPLFLSECPYRQNAYTERLKSYSSTFGVSVWRCLPPSL